MSALERNPQVPAPTSHKVLGPGIEGRGIPRGPRATRIDWPFLRPPERVPEAPVVSRDHLPQLEKIQVVLRSRRDQADFHCGVSRLITSIIWNFQRFLHTLAATQEVPHIPVSTREEARESRPHPEEPHFCLIATEEGSIPFLVGQEIPAFPLHLKRRCSAQERRKELQGRATIPRVPQMYQAIPGKAVFPAVPRLSCRGSPHTTVARGTALWECLVGKPLGKA